jgi:uncharacterized protein (TIGR02271 family)
MNNGNEGNNYSGDSQSKDMIKAGTVTVPIIEEHVTVGKKVIETARVTVSKTINEKTEAYEIPLKQEEVVVKRVPKNELIDTMPAASRYEGDIMIIPVLKEVAVIEKRIMLVEEIHISKLQSEKTETQEVTVRKEEVNVTRTEL